MVYEPDIVKDLRREERKGSLKSGKKSCCWNKTSYNINKKIDLKEIKDELYLLFYLILIISAEISVAYIDVRFGILFHFMILTLLIIHYFLISKSKIIMDFLQRSYIESRNRPVYFLKKIIEEKEKFGYLLLVLTLAPMIRIMSLVLPLSNFSQIFWFVLTGVAIYLSFIVLKIQQKIKLEDCGIKLPKLKHLPIEIGIILLGVPFGLTEYYILKPDPIIQFFTLKNFLITFLIFLLSIALVEEIVFRGILQKRSIDIFGKWKGLFFVSLVFAALHIGNLSILDCFFVFLIGLLYAIIVYNTKTIIGVTISHTVVNMFLFLICPLTLA